jgi:histone deacetylase 1/2
MAFASLSSGLSASLSLAAFLPPVTEKLHRANHQSWKAQMLSALRGAQLADWLEATAVPPAKFLPIDPAKPDESPKPNPEYASWVSKDQTVLSYVLTNLSKEILGHVNNEVTAKGTWAAIEGMFASQSRAKIITTRMALANVTKGTSTISEYYAKVKSLADEMAAAGKRLDDEEIISYLLNGLDQEYDPVSTVVANRVEPIAVSELFTQLVSHEQRLDLRTGGSQSSVNVAAKGGRSGGNYSRGGGRGNVRGNGHGGGHGNRGGFTRGGGNNNDARAPFQSGVICQVCGKEGHPTFRCFKRYDSNFQGGSPQKSASTATTNYGVDSNWYMDTGATDHITGELDKLTIRDKYTGNENVHAANGAGMEIEHVGHSTLRSQSRSIHLNNILHVPKTHKNLVSVHRLTHDNNAYVEFHPTHFFVKEQGTKRTLLQGRSKGGLYPFPSSSSSSNKQAFSAVKPTEAVWHSRLGHASPQVVQQILRHHRLSFDSSSNNHVVCDACQLEKSHQLPYSRSTSRSASPLDLIFSDVWGPAPKSVGRNIYYVSFIDDFSKFTWIYLLKRKSEVFSCFREFQQLVERQFDRKIKTMQTDWGGEYQSLHSFFKQVGIAHHISCPHKHQQNGSAERKHRHIVEVGLSILAHASMPLKYWDEAFLTAVFLINRLPSQVIDGATPLERLTGKQTDYSFLRTFGCACWPNLCPYNKHKLQFRSRRCVFLGYSNFHKGFKCLDPSEGRIYISRDVVFDEHVFPFAQLHPNAGALLRAELAVLPYILLNSSSSFGNAHVPDITSSFSAPTNGVPSAPLSGCDRAGDTAATGNVFLDENAASSSAPGRNFMCFPVGGSLGSQDVSAPADGLESTSGSAGGLSSGDGRASTPEAPGFAAAPAPSPLSSPARVAAPPDPSAAGNHNGDSNAGSRADLPTISHAGSSADAAPTSLHVPETAPRPVTRPVTCLQHGIRKPKTYSDGTVRWGMSTVTAEEPSTVTEALQDPKWVEAMDAEYKALMHNKTWHLVTPPRGKNTIDCKWVYKVKRKADGSVDRYKARLVAKGYKQCYGLDYEDRLVQWSRLQQFD